MREYYVYMLRCYDGSYYVGVTNNVELRFGQHQEGMDPKCYTFRRRPVKCVYSAQFQDVRDAIWWEKHIKRWSRKKKEALIRGDGNTLHKLAVCCNKTHSKFLMDGERKSVMAILSSRAETRDEP